jgi:hypothetical protein
VQYAFHRRIKINLLEFLNIDGESSKEIGNVLKHLSDRVKDAAKVLASRDEVGQRAEAEVAWPKYLQSWVRSVTTSEVDVN